MTTRLPTLRLSAASLLLVHVMCAPTTAQDSAPAAKPLHLLILSGQSNMAGLNPKLSFTPELQKALPDDELVVVKDAAGGQPIRRWFKKWKTGAKAEGENPPTQKKKSKRNQGKKGKANRKAKANGDLYDRLMTKVRAAIGKRKPTTVTFVWMQGERDAREGHGDIYAASMRGLIDQLKSDLKRDDLNFVIGRLSDFKSKAYRDWDKVRKAQVAVAKADAHGVWVDTDELNGKKNGLHYTKDGYLALGKLFALSAAELIGKSKKGAVKSRGSSTRK